MRRWFKKTLLVVLILTFAVIDTISIYEGSAPYQESNIAQAGGVIALQDSPLEMEKVVLTFDIPKLPPEYFDSEKQLLSYDGKVTTEYTLYNPTDKQVTTRLVSPIGCFPMWSYRYKGEYKATEDAERYDITIDGKIVDKNIRHTWFPMTGQLDVEVDIPRLKEGYVEHSFYTPDLPIFYKTYKISGIDKDWSLGDAILSFKWDGDSSKTKLFLNGLSRTEVLEDGIYVDEWVANGDIITIAFIGELPKDELELEIYKRGDRETKCNATITIVDGQGENPATFEELVFRDYDESKGVSKSDWYNAYVDCLTAYEGDYGVLTRDVLDITLFDMLFRWYEYEITLEPGQRVVNTVTSPVYPERNSTYTGGVYNYLYIWSTLRTWEELQKIEIVINTPLYLFAEHTITVDYNFAQTESGYTLSLDGVSKEEAGEMFYFVLSNTKNPIKSAPIATVFMILVLLLICSIPVGFVVGIVFLVRYWWKLYKNKK